MRNPFRLNRLSAKARRNRQHPWRAGIRHWVKIAVLTWLGVTVSPVLTLRWVDPPASAFMIRAMLRGQDVVCEWVPKSRIPPQLALAVVAAEDQRFPTHFGFDFVEIQKAVTTLFRGGRMRGASTITQQTAKNLFLWPGRNFLRKVLEAYFTVLLETLWPKGRILEVYLNIAQFGDGVYGVGAASRIYFGKAPAKLTRYEMSLLASVLPDPVDLHPDAPSRFVLERAAFVRKHMTSLGGVAYLQGM